MEYIKGKEGDKGGENHHCFRFCSPPRRFLALFYLLLLAFGVYFSYDIPGSLQQIIMQKFELNLQQFSYLYSVYSWPNIIMCIFTGYLIDRTLGVELACVLFMSIVVLGLCLFILGGIFQLYHLTLVGRFVFGIGGESVGICLLTYIIIWFTGKELNMVFAVLSNITRIGPTIVYQAATPFYDYVLKSPTNHPLGITFLVMSSPVLISFGSSVLLAMLKPEDKKQEQLNKKDPSDSLIQLKDILSFPLQFWLLCIITNMCITTVLSFLALSQENLTIKYNISLDSADYLLHFFNVISAILSPLFGLYVDNRGRNLAFLTASIIVGILAHSLVAFTTISPFIVMFVLSISFSFLISSVWPMFCISVKENQTSTAYGIVLAIMNAWITANTLITGFIIDELDILALEIFYIICLNVSVLLLAILWMVDRRNDSTLNMTAEQRKYYEIRNHGISQTTLDRISSISSSIGQSLGNISSLTIPSISSADFKLC